MTIIILLFLGLIAGIIANKLTNETGKGILLDSILGVVGSFVGGATFGLFGQTSPASINFWSILVAAVGAVVLLSIFHLMTDPPKSPVL